MNSKKIADQYERSIEVSESIYNKFVFKDNETLYSFTFEDIKQAFNDDFRLNYFLRKLEPLNQDISIINKIDEQIIAKTIYRPLFTKVKGTIFVWNIGDGFVPITTKEIDTMILLHYIYFETTGNEQELFYNDWYEKMLAVESINHDVPRRKVNIIKDYLNKLKNG